MEVVESGVGVVGVGAVSEGVEVCDVGGGGVDGVAEVVGGVGGFAPGVVGVDEDKVLVRVYLLAIARLIIPSGAHKEDA